MLPNSGACLGVVTGLTESDHMTDLTGGGASNLRTNSYLESELQSARKEIARLRDALQPFAKIVPSPFYPADGSARETYRVYLTDQEPPDFTGIDLRRARAALGIKDDNAL